MRLLREYHQQSLETVKWAVYGQMGLVGGALLLLTLIAGINLLVYNRRYKEDKEALHGEIERELGLQLANSRVQLMQDHDRLLKELSEQFETKLSSAKKNLSASIESAVRAVRSELHELKLERKIEEIEAQDRSRPTSWLMLLIAEAFDLTHTAEIGWLKRSDLLDYTKAAMEKGVKMDADVASKLIAELERLPDEFKHQVLALREQIVGIRRAEWLLQSAHTPI